MHYSPRKLLAVLGAFLAVAACSPSPQCQEIFKDAKSSLRRGVPTALYPSLVPPSALMRMRYEGGNSVTFLDYRGNTFVPREVKLPANSDGSVSLKGGETIRLAGTHESGGEHYEITVTFGGFELDQAYVVMSVSRCTGSGV